MINTTPQSTADMVFANAQTADLIADILSGTYPFPVSGKTALCLFGNYGTGKTTYANIFCEEFELAKGGAALGMPPTLVSCDKTKSIDQILKRCVASSNVMSLNQSDLHYFIFDEVDNLTSDGQRALKGFLNRSDVVCILTTNYLDKVDKGLLNRCVSLNFNAGDPVQIRQRVQQLLRQACLPALNSDLVDEIIEKSDGGWRDIIPVAFRHAKKQQPPKSVPPLTVIK